MISIDRYMAFNYPLRYGHVTNKRTTVIKISIVWVVSFCIAGPLFVLSTLDSRQSLHHYKGTSLLLRRDSEYKLAISSRSGSQAASELDEDVRVHVVCVSQAKLHHSVQLASRSQTSLRPNSVTLSSWRPARELVADLLVSRIA